MFGYEIDWMLTLWVISGLLSVVSFVGVCFSGYYEYKYRGDFDSVYVVFAALSLAPIANLIGAVLFPITALDYRDKYLTVNKPKPAEPIPTSLIKLCDEFIAKKDYEYFDSDRSRMMSPCVKNNKTEVTIYPSCIMFKSKQYATDRYASFIKSVQFNKEEDAINQLYKSYVQTQTGA